MTVAPPRLSLSNKKPHQLGVLPGLLDAGCSHWMSKEGKREEQTLTSGRQYSAPGNSLSIITLCTSEWGIFRLVQRGTEKDASSLSHRKIHRVHQELTPHCKCRLQNLLLTNSCRLTTSNGCSSGSRKMLENDMQLGQTYQTSTSFCSWGFSVTCKLPVLHLPLSSPNSTSAFHGFPLISCFQWLGIEVLTFCPYSVPAWKGI